ncbi:LysR family transcriptional regulator [Streptomonospora litoralis]|uniref:Hca operon transcriptional activator n=1 Tax=Streptomonospora litoralis TaxID=2498135 RepID=A0A4P6Q7G5_9ACTN|nr:LysR substrate-binding domain-containing protein [Streptomonospora litoralis]QBI54894.1 Hca operon transcriptional activator [Streptomonospora litoralis]
MEPDFRLLRSFVAVAEELHFGEAAVRLRVAQPALSKQIAKLESDLGVSLFDRTSRRVRLTPAGEALLPQARTALEQARAGLRRARAVGERTSGVLRVGFMTGAIQPALLRAFEREYPAAGVDVKRYDWFDQTACLRDGRADIAFVCPPIEEADIRVEVLAEQTRLAVLPRGHPAAGRSALSILDLGEEPVIGHHRAPRAWARFSAVDPRPDGSPAVYGPAVDTVEEKLEHAAAGHGVGLVPSSIRDHYDRDDVVFVPVTDIPPCQSALAWLPPARSPLMRAFVALARDRYGR